MGQAGVGIISKPCSKGMKAGSRGGLRPRGMASKQGQVWKLPGKAELKGQMLGTVGANANKARNNRPRWRGMGSPSRAHLSVSVVGHGGGWGACLRRLKQSLKEACCHSADEDTCMVQRSQVLCPRSHGSVAELGLQPADHASSGRDKAAGVQV